MIETELGEDGEEARRMPTILCSETLGIKSKVLGSECQGQALGGLRLYGGTESSLGRLRHLGLVKSKSFDRRLHFSTEELNDFFSDNATAIDDLICAGSFYLGETNFDDSKFY